MEMQYIMDGNGNYYRVNGENQLVVAEGKEDASVFTAFDASLRIGTGQKAKFYQTMPIRDEGNKIISISDKNTAKAEAMQPEFEYDITSIDWLEYINLFCYLAEAAKNYQTELNAKISVADKEICDLLHYVELYDLSDEEAIGTMDLLKDARQRRRDIKDEERKVDLFVRNIGTSAMVAKAKTCIKEFRKLDTRKYTPRELSELFAGMEGRKTDRFAYREKKSCVDVETMCEQEEIEVEAIKQKREETIYDGRENNWVEFAKQQRNFYANVQQYMFNLECELGDTEEAIESVLSEIEDANYNVAQGYKAFRELKDLRNEKKAKLQELEQIRKITECFDCTAMAEAYQYAVEEIAGGL